MAGGFDEDPSIPQLVFADEIMSCSFACHDPKMLCFGGATDHSGQESGSICMDHTSTLPKSNKKRKGSDPGCLSGGPTGSQKAMSRHPTHFTGHHATKILKKEKFGERIFALQRLVSPFGKTDTASVLHEASCYIRFLQDQVQVLCSPYLHSHNHPAGNDRMTERCREKNMDLRGRGLCLVPIELALRVGNESNGADLWSSAAMVDNVYF